MNLNQIDTPALVVDLDTMESNIIGLQRNLDLYGVKNRPHIKTHKVPAIAHLQLRNGAIGIACQKIGEAEIMAAAGITDILITFNIVGEQKIERLIRLAKRTQLSVTVDDLSVAKHISDAASKAGVKIGVLAEIASSLERTGLTNTNDLVIVARELASLPGLEWKGLMIYPSGPANTLHIAEAIDALKTAGLPPEVVSGGGTAEAYQVQKVPGITEHRAGTYVFNDKMIIDKSAASLEQCALTVLTTVVSCPTEERAIIDAGTKTFSSDYGYPMGIVVNYPDFQIYKMNEEHGYMNIRESTKRPKIGERLRVIPNHVCSTVNLHNYMYGLRGEDVEVIWDIAARGKIR